MPWEVLWAVLWAVLSGRLAPSPSQPRPSSASVDGSENAYPPLPPRIGVNPVGSLYDSLIVG